MNDAQPCFLYVEDDLHSREVVELLLTKIMDFKQIDFFESSDNFMERLGALPKIPDVIFLDIYIRPTNGYELLKMIRNDPNYQNTLLIAVTASVMSSDVAQLKEAGFDGLIGKPIVHKVFPRLINNILSGEPVWYIP